MDKLEEWIVRLGFVDYKLFHCECDVRDKWIKIGHQ